jgi:putative membrane protein
LSGFRFTAYFGGMNAYLFFKALHITGFVAWFAGIFYLVRLFVYHREAWDLSQQEQSRILREQYSLMENRLYYIIQTPAMVLTLIGGVSMLWINPAWLQSSWMHFKLVLVFTLIGYHFSCAYYMKKLAKSAKGLNSFGYRLYNELPTLLLIAIVMLAVWKSLKGLWLGLVILLILGLLFFLAAKWYKQKREKS